MRVRIGIVAAAAVLAVGGTPAGGAEAVDPPTDDTCVVHELHQVFLGRDATSEEVTEWKARLADDEPTSALARELAGSDEWLGAQVDALYEQALDRPADPSGKAHWVGELRRGVLVSRVAAQLFGSQEVWQRVGQTPGGYVDDLYQRILGRPADTGGRAHWVAEVARLGRGRVAAAFFGSVESRTDRVEALYQQLLGRAPDAAGRAHWVAALRRVNDVRLAVLLAGSAELRTRAARGACAGGPVAGTITRESVATDGTQGSSFTRSSDITPDGRHLVFSTASPLVPGTNPIEGNVYVRDLETGTTTLITPGIGGPANGDSHGVSISDDGERVAFESVASNLVPGDTNQTTDVFVWERGTGQLTRVSVTSDEQEADDLSEFAAISPDGGYVAFTSWANELGQPGAGTLNPFSSSLYLRDLAAGTTTLLTPTIDEYEPSWLVQDPSVSEGADVVTFSSSAENLVEGDTNDRSDVFAWERDTGEVRLLSDDAAGGPTDGASNGARVTDAGTLVSFRSEASDIVAGDTDDLADLFVMDLATGTTTLVPTGSGAPLGSISGDGTHVGFSTAAADVVPGDANGVADAFVLERATGEVVRISRAPGGRQADGPSGGPTIGGGGAFALFLSDATNLVAGDTNGEEDAFVWRATPQM